MGSRLLRMALLLAPALCWGAGAAAQAVRVAGSSTVFPFAAAVAEQVGSQGRWPTPVVESVGTGSGIERFCTGLGVGTPDVTDASRPMTATESSRCARNGVRVLALRLGRDGMIIASARGGAPLALTREQLYLAIARQVPVAGRLVANPHRRWSQISPALPDLPIRIYGPATNHGTRDAFVALAMVPPCERLAPVRALATAERQRACQAVREDGAWIDMPGDYSTLFRRLLAEPGAVGVLGFSWLDQNRDRIQAARIDGVVPTEESIRTWRYPLSRPLFLYVKVAHLGRTPGLVEYLEEFLGERAAGEAGYLVARGLTPLPQGERRAELAKLRRAVPRTP